MFIKFPLFLLLLGFSLRLMSFQLRPDRHPLSRLLASFENRINTVADTVDQIRISILFRECRTKLCLFIKQLLQFIGDAIMIGGLDAIGVHIPHSLCKLVQLLLMLLSILLSHETYTTLTLV